MKNRINNKNIKIEWIIWGMYVCLLIFISIFHEPWFDEAESWQIARCAPLKEIILEIPHYEGHPPLWHLILSIPAKLNMPYEISLKGVGIIFSSITTYFIVFKSPFKKIIRCVLPFTYFIFYQYGVVVRTYCVMGLVFMLMAVTFKKKEDHPFRFIISLLLLCFTSAYGIVIAAGIAIAWGIDIISENGLIESIKNIHRDSRIKALIVLLVGAVFDVALIVPVEETMATAYVYENTILERILYSGFSALADSVVTDVLSRNIKDNRFDMVSLLSGVVIGLIIWICVVLRSNYKKIKYFVIPYIFFGAIISNLYFNLHHEGIIFLLLIWYLWICKEDNAETIWESISIRINDKDRLLLLKFYRFFIGVCLSVSIFYSVIAMINDIIHPYNCCRELVELIKSNKLYNEYIMFSWDESFEEYGIKWGDTNNIGTVVDIMPYFNHDLSTNLNPTEKDREYLVHRFSEELNERNIAALREKDPPGVIIGKVDVNGIYDEVTPKDYIPVLEFMNRGFNIWKNTYTEENEYIFLRKDLLEKYELKEIPKKYVFK